MEKEVEYQGIDLDTVTIIYDCDDGEVSVCTNYGGVSGFTPEQYRAFIKAEAQRLGIIHQPEKQQ